MRRVQVAPRRGRQKKCSNGCFGCLGRLLTFLIFFVLLAGIGYRMFQSSGLQTRWLKTQYPIKYQDFVEEYAEEYALEKELVFAIIRTESKFDPYAVSKTGARGLMQIQEETAQDCAKELKLLDFTVDTLFDPQVNIQIGCYYFGKLLQHYHGERTLALAAYNGGPGNLEKWLKDESNLNEQGELIYIPFTETRNYVKRVIEACEKYREIYSIPE